MTGQKIDGGASDQGGEIALTVASADASTRKPGRIDLYLMLADEVSKPSEKTTLFTIDVGYQLEGKKWQRTKVQETFERW